MGNILLMSLSKWLSREDDYKRKEDMIAVYTVKIQWSGTYIAFTREDIAITTILLLYQCASSVVHYLGIGYATYAIYPDFGNMFNQIHIILLLSLTWTVLTSNLRNKESVERAAMLFVRLEKLVEKRRDTEVDRIGRERDKYKEQTVKWIWIMFNMVGVSYYMAGILANISKSMFNSDNILRLAPICTYWPSMGGYVVLEVVLPNALQLFSIVVCGRFLGGAVLFFLVTIIYLRYHLQLVLYWVENLNALSWQAVRRSMDRGEILDIRAARAQLIREVVHHHRVTIECAKALNEYYSSIMLMVFISGGIDIALGTLLAVFTEANIAFKLEAAVLCLAELAAFAMLTFSGDYISHMSLEISKSFYFSEWIDWSIDIKKLMLISMCCNRKPMEVKAGNIFSVNKLMFSSILQTCYSVINLYVAIR